VFCRYNSCKHPMLLRNTLRAAAAVPKSHRQSLCCTTERTRGRLILHHNLRPYIARGDFNLSVSLHSIDFEPRARRVYTDLSTLFALNCYRHLVWRQSHQSSAVSVLSPPVSAIDFNFCSFLEA
jgi:hypothetical protein